MTRGLIIAGIFAIALAACAAAQEPILELSITPSTVHIPAGGGGHLRLIAKNTSVRRADDLTASLASPDRFTILTEPEELKAIDPFSTGAIDIVLKTGKDTPEGDYNGSLAIVYTYCIEELCFQIAETRDFDIVVESAGEAVQTPSVTGPIARRTIPWPWIGFGVGLVILAAALLEAKRTMVNRYIYLVLVVIASAGLGYGVADQQHEQAQGIGAVLCTSCVGLEEGGPSEASFSPAGIARLARIEGDRELIVFYAPWCHACAYAEEMVALAAEQSPGISCRFINAEEAPELAAEYGVIRSGKTIVPAIVRVDTGEVIFGIEGFEERLIEMLEEGG